MIKRLIDQLIITIGQYDRFGEQQYVRQFDMLLSKLEKATGLDRQGAIKFLEKEVKGENAA
ncbi:hypothetical protein ACFFF5_21170 [Lederbergia wuyishanensis]|uniref:Uncharacterized protein n=1 Tax=Lederbergia wuyishanensis TaxID=1347903 RepID=A0ABU0D773_9BACI|nr:hypothetical protein [Lederbergia wuyishanensis]MCJ8008928.1 hypothetical protein [Lederbergia wuyishanensis]MDQ0344254.1 hypothetical protein [Lederbergia wuyishanensis]